MPDLKMPENHSRFRMGEFGEWEFRTCWGWLPLSKLPFLDKEDCANAAVAHFYAESQKAYRAYKDIDNRSQSVVPGVVYIKGDDKIEQSRLLRVMTDMDGEAIAWLEWRDAR